MPTTSWPSRTRRAAATLESTPPERATAMRILASLRPHGRPPRAPLAPGTASGDRRHDRDLVFLAHRRAEALALPDVLLVEEEVHELPGLTLVVEQPALEAGEPGVQLVDRGAEVLRLHCHCRFSAAQAAERSGDAEHGHVTNSL